MAIVKSKSFQQTGWKWLLRWTLLCLLSFFLFDTAFPLENTNGTMTLLVKLRKAPSGLMKAGQNTCTSFGDASLDRFGESIGLVKIEKALQNYDPKSSHGLEFDDLSKWVKLTIPRKSDLRETLKALRENPAVEYAQPNHVYKLDYVPNDPEIDRQWGLSRINCFEAWETETGSRDVIVGVIDTGIDYGHPDLRSNLWINSGEDVNQNNAVDDEDFNGNDDDGNGFVDDIQGWDFTDAPNFPDGGDYLERDNDPMDEHGHGTGVAGIIAAVMDNEIGIAGVAPNSRVMNLRAFTVKGNGEEDDVASAILYALANGVQIINMSWGDTVVSRLMDDVVRFAYEQGCTMIASAGNNATDAIHYPSGNQETISVGAVGEDDFIAGFSNYGATVDVMAPGVNIYTTALDGKYTQMQGTSFSAPFVSGLAALLLSHERNLSAEDIRGQLVASAFDLGSSGWDSYYAAGRVDAAAALGASDFSIAHISSPNLDQAFASPPVVICGSAWSPFLAGYTIEFGYGDDPSEWTEITRVDGQRVLDDTLAVWSTFPDDDGSYVIRLRIENSDGSLSEDKVRIFIDKTPPVISDVKFLPMIEGNRYGILIQFKSDDLGQGYVHYRPANKVGEWQTIPLKYRTREHRLMLTQDVGADLFEVKLSVENGAKALTQTDTIYTADLRQQRIASSLYVQLNQNISPGFFLNKTTDFNANGNPEIIMSEYNDGALGETALFEYSGQEFARVFSTPITVIPRDVGDSDGDGKIELLAGYGINSYIFESPAIGDFPTELAISYQGDDNVQYWASRFADLDGDNRDEIIMKVVRSGGEESTTQFEVFETIADNAYDAVATLPNPTFGENGTGVPHCEIGDFDGDGRVEVLLGDSDGDLYIYEADGDNSYVSTWQGSMPLEDTIDFLSCGDYDGDGQLEFIAGCHTDPNLNTEHEYDARHWYYRVYDSHSDNSYSPVAEWYFFGFESPKFFDSGVSSGDVDADGMDEILICVFPDFYIIDYDIASGKYSPTWYAWSIRSNAAVIADADMDGITEFYINNGQEVRAFRSLGQTTGPAPPVGIEANPLDETHIKLKWEPVAGAEVYKIYRGGNQSGLVQLAEAIATAFVDSSVDNGRTYWYAVRSIDYNKTPNESQFSRIVKATPGPKPFMVSARAVSNQALRVVFSEIMNASASNPTNYSLSSGLAHPTSVIHDKSGSEVVLSLDSPFPSEGDYAVVVEDVYDSDGTPIDSIRNKSEFQVNFPTNPPYVVAGRMVSYHLLEIEFNEAMDEGTCNVAANYDLGEDITVASAELIAPDYQRVRLKLKSQKPIGALGTSYYIQVRNVKNAKGIGMQAGRGDRIALIFHKQDLSKAFVYPNPFRLGLGKETITFANLTKSAHIRIMTLAGRTIKTLEENDGDGGVEWDLRDESGNFVSSGIYLFLATGNGDEKMGKFAVLR